MHLVDWEERKKQKVKEVLTVDYMSSEEDGEGEDKHCLITVPLPWESNKLRRYKDQLDKVYLQNSTRHALAQQKLRRKKNTVSSRVVPDKAPAWAIKSTASDAANETEDDVSSFTEA